MWQPRKSLHIYQQMANSWAEDNLSISVIFVRYLSWTKVYETRRIVKASISSVVSTYPLNNPKNPQLVHIFLVPAHLQVIISISPWWMYEAEVLEHFTTVISDDLPWKWSVATRLLAATLSFSANYRARSCACVLVIYKWGANVQWKWPIHTKSCSHALVQLRRRQVGMLFFSKTPDTSPWDTTSIHKVAMEYFDQAHIVWSPSRVH